MTLLHLKKENFNYNGNQYYRNFQLLTYQKPDVKYKVTLLYLKLENENHSECRVEFTQPKFSFGSLILNEISEFNETRTFYTEQNILTINWVYLNILISGHTKPYTGKWELDLVIEEL